jgi:hypothetical protein
MSARLKRVAWLLFLAAIATTDVIAGGVTPEQIYQPSIDWKSVVGTWEILPDENPLAEKNKSSSGASVRTIMTLRKDGTCRVFNEGHPMGSDGLWTFEQHEMFIRFPSGSRAEFYVYGVKGDFMVTRSPIKGGKDQLWSRVK